VNPEELKAWQKKERDRCFQEILNSTSPKKVIVAGPGTGKSFTFGQLLRQARGNKLAMTFIRKLVTDMESKLVGIAEVKTFHAYCKKILHEQKGNVGIAPFLSGVVAKDAALIGNRLSDFDSKFQTLDEKSPEVAFHISRGDYYDAVGFDDSVFRLYKLLQEDPNVVPYFEQIVIDEFQDFHRLEVEFIHELSKKGNILIVGDDDQAVYDRRNASPRYLRDLHKSESFKRFDLPFCSRCPEVIVHAVSAIVEKAQANGCLVGRVPKNYECFLPDKEADSKKYPKLMLACCTLARVVPKYIAAEIAKIDADDIAESHCDGHEYPTVLVVGPRHYLQEVAKYFEKIGLSFDYRPSEEIGYSVVDGYRWLLRDEHSNLGWRLLLEFYFDEKTQKELVTKSRAGTRMEELLPKNFVAQQKTALELLRTLQRQEKTPAEVGATLRGLLKQYSGEVTSFFEPKEEASLAQIDKAKPSILLTSFVGCKGLSAGHVFIVGMHNESMPLKSNAIADVEISRFIVALTRTRKQCHIISLQWLIMPVDQNKKPRKAFARSTFVDWIPAELIEDRGKLKAENLQRS